MTYDLNLIYVSEKNAQKFPFSKKPRQNRSPPAVLDSRGAALEDPLPGSRQVHQLLQEPGRAMSQAAGTTKEEEVNVQLWDFTVPKALYYMYRGIKLQVSLDETQFTTSVSCC